MNSKIATEVIKVIGGERAKRSRRRDRLNDPNLAYDQWLFRDEPFNNDMCLMVLIALRHQVERELVSLAARANGGQPITRKEYEQNVADQRKRLKRNKNQGGGWAGLIATLNLKSFPQWATSMETLRLLANCLKHEPTQEPNQELLHHLKLPLKPAGRLIFEYLPLPESSCFREGLAQEVGLPHDADYCTIAETFVGLTNRFLEEVQKKTSLAQVKASKLSGFAC